MMQERLDTRRVVVELDTKSTRKRYEGMAISYSVTITGNAHMNEAQIKIANINKEDRDFILTATSPLRRHKERKTITLYAGYASTGIARLFCGDITASSVTQPPDIWLCVKAKTGFFARSSIVAVGGEERQSLSTLSGKVAGHLGLQLDFQADDKSIENYAFTGGAGLQVDKLGEMGLVNAYVDDDRLVVKPEGVALSGKVRRLSKHSGMVGIPELTEQGVKVKMLHDLETTVGGMLEITSELNPAANGRYVIFKATYTGESHGQPFYIEAEGRPEGRPGWRL